MSEYFPKPRSFGVNVKFELDLSNYAAKLNSQNHEMLIHQILLKRLI